MYMDISCCRWFWDGAGSDFHLDIILALESHGEVPDEEIEAMPERMVLPGGLVAALMQNSRYG